MWGKKLCVCRSYRVKMLTERSETGGQEIKRLGWLEVTTEHQRKPHTLLLLRSQGWPWRQNGPQVCMPRASLAPCLGTALPNPPSLSVFFLAIRRARSQTRDLTAFFSWGKGEKHKKIVIHLFNTHGELCALSHSTRLWGCDSELRFLSRTSQES